MQLRFCPKDKLSIIFSISCKLYNKKVMEIDTCLYMILETTKKISYKKKKKKNNNNKKVMGIDTCILETSSIVLLSFPSLFWRQTSLATFRTALHTESLALKTSTHLHFLNH